MKLRTSSHSLKIERGRYNKTDVKEHFAHIVWESMTKSTLF